MHKTAGITPLYLSRFLIVKSPFLLFPISCFIIFNASANCFRDQLWPCNNRAYNYTEASKFNDSLYLLRCIDITFCDNRMFCFRENLTNDRKNSSSSIFKTALCSVYPTIVVPIKSNPKFICMKCLFYSRTICHKELIRIFAFTSLKNSSRVLPSGRSAPVASTAMISGRTSINSSISFIVGVI